MPLCLCACKDHGLKNCNAFTVCPPCLGTIRFVGCYQWSKLFFFGIVRWPFCWAKGCKKLSKYWVIPASGNLSAKFQGECRISSMNFSTFQAFEIQQSSNQLLEPFVHIIAGRAALVKCHEFRWSYFLAQLRVSQKLTVCLPPKIGEVYSWIFQISIMTTWNHDDFSGRPVFFFGYLNLSEVPKR